MKKTAIGLAVGATCLVGAVLVAAPTWAANVGKDAQAAFVALVDKMSKDKPRFMARHRALLDARYDLGDKPGSVKMTRGKPVQEGVRVKLPKATTWEALAALPPEQIKERGLWPAGFLPLPHANHPEGGMLFPQVQIDEVKKQTGRDLTRFDLEFDVPQHLLPEFPPAIFLTTHPEAGDVSQGKLITLDNFQTVFGGLLNPKQLEGLRLLLTPFPQQQFNATHDRRSLRPSEGVACLDCHANGHTNGANHLVGDIRPQELRHRIETPSLRGVNVQRLFGSQRALKSVEDFTEFEQRSAYFDGELARPAEKGVNILERGSQVHFMGELQNLLDFPPAPKLGIDGKLDPAKATPAELRGQALFFGKARCAECHPAPHYTDNTMHDLQTGRFFKPVTINDHAAVADGAIKTFPLRGIKESPPYLHDGRLLTLEDTVEFFNLVSGTQLTTTEKADLAAFLKTL
ncbi:MAG: cytochrome B6 [Deltaproteobacteria bacterium]|nr:cytochrome B6 [Deltaproteobacteria bacterium]